MSVNLVDKTTGDLTTIAGETLWADSPIGSIVPYGGNTAPSGWLLCQGQAISRTTYAELFAVIGTTFGSGNGSTTFNLPDLRNKTTMGGGTLGASSEGALPNITGGRDNTLSDMVWMGDGISQGAIKHGTPKSEYQLPGGGALGSFAPLLFDASESSNLYKNNQSYVEPSNVRVNYIIKAKMVAMPSDFMSKVDEAVEDVLTPTRLTDENLDNIKTAGIYYSEGTDSLANKPSASLNNNYIKVEKVGSRILQTFICGNSIYNASSGGYYMRIYGITGASWSPWKQIW